MESLCLSIPSALRNCTRFSSLLQEVPAQCSSFFSKQFQICFKCILTRMEKIILCILEVFILASQLPTHFKNLVTISWRKIPVRFLGTLKFPIHFSSPRQLKNINFSFFTRGPLPWLHLPLTSCPGLATPRHD